MDTKRCSKCKQPKPLDQFHRRQSSPDGRTNQCAECIAGYYQQNKGPLKAHAKERRRRLSADPNYQERERQRSRDSQ